MINKFLNILRKYRLHILLFVIGIGLGYLIFTIKMFLVDEDVVNEEDAKSIRQGGYMFINPLLECEVGSSISSKELQSFKYELNNFVIKEKSTGKVNDVAVYFRDLNNGPWIGINEDADFTPASLLKVPLMFAYYKTAEDNPSVLLKEIVYVPTQDTSNDNVLPVDQLEPGKSYTVEYLINRMIIYSDNQAFDTLMANIGFDKLKKVHEDLGIKVPNKDTPEDFVSVTSYASLFRVLYNSSYLNREMSEKALALLSQAYFEDGIVRGLPDDIVVSHKYGIRILDGTSSLRQLHDCGIVYYPKHPYLLCVMTRGKDVDDLSIVLEDISRFVYEKINAKYQK